MFWRDATQATRCHTSFSMSASRVQRYSFVSFFERLIVMLRVRFMAVRYYETSRNHPTTFLSLIQILLGVELKVGVVGAGVENGLFQTHSAH